MFSRNCFKLTECSGGAEDLIHGFKGDWDALLKYSADYSRQKSDGKDQYVPKISTVLRESMLKLPFVFGSDPVPRGNSTSASSTQTLERWETFDASPVHHAYDPIHSRNDSEVDNIQVAFPHQQSVQVAMKKKKMPALGEKEIDSFRFGKMDTFVLGEIPDDRDTICTANNEDEEEDDVLNFFSTKRSELKA